MTSTATVSAVIPVYNGERYLADAIRSVLNQSLAVIECLVIDDGSDDRTPEVAHQFGPEVTYVRRDRGGVSAARNDGARRSQGEFVGFLDHDDQWLPEKLERQLHELQQRPAAMALCAMAVIGQAGQELGTIRLQAQSDLVTGMLTFDGTRTVSCSSTGVVRRAEFLAAGGFDPALSMSADWDLLLRMLLNGGIAYVDEPLVLYRLHDANMSRNVKVMEHDMRYAFAKAFADPRLPDSARRRKRHAYGRLYRMLAGSYRDAGHRADAARALIAAVRHEPSVALELVRRRGGSSAGPSS
jgi:glycosyltransferase involved in cell wall biosynthesis